MDLDRLLQRVFGDDEPEHLGTGWISGTMSVFLGLLGLAAVACLIWPQALTSPEVRALLPLPWVRGAIELIIGLAFLLGLASSLLRRRKVLGFTGMGLALAEAALARGASVTLIAANVAGEAPAGAELVGVKTAAELDEACREALGRCDMVFMAAAVADFRPSATAGGKLDRAGGAISIELEPTNDILKGLCSRRTSGQAIVAFAAEHGGDFEERAREKLARKGADAIVVNDVSREGIGFDSPDNSVTLIDADRTERVSKAPKREVAEAILDFCEPLRRSARRAPA